MNGSKQEASNMMLGGVGNDDYQGGVRQHAMMAFNRGRLLQLAHDPRCILRAIEIVTSIICLGLIRGFLLMGGQPDWFLLSFFTPAAYLLITPALVIHQIVEDPLKPPLSELLLDIVAFLLYLVSGICAFRYYSVFYTKQSFKIAGMSYGVFAILSSHFHLANSLISHKEKISNTVLSVQQFTTKHIRA